MLSNRREGTLEVSVAAPERDPDPKVSPWGGISGAAVWSAGRVIGLIAEHHRSDGLGRLAATRVDRWHERLSPARLRELCDLTGLPAKPGDLREVVPPTGSELVEAGYHAQVRDIAPWELRGREEELAELVRFCAGDEPYQWWLAEAWAGKSALAAWFVLNPPAGVRVGTAPSGPPAASPTPRPRCGRWPRWPGRWSRSTWTAPWLWPARRRTRQGPYPSCTSGSGRGR